MNETLKLVFAYLFIICLFLRHVDAENSEWMTVYKVIITTNDKIERLTDAVEKISETDRRMEDRVHNLTVIIEKMVGVAECLNNKVSTIESAVEEVMKKIVGCTFVGMGSYVTTDQAGRKPKVLE